MSCRQVVFAVALAKRAPEHFAAPLAVPYCKRVNLRSLIVASKMIFGLYERSQLKATHCSINCLAIWGLKGKMQKSETTARLRNPKRDKSSESGRASWYPY